MIDYRDDNYWNAIPKPWKYEECELRYLYGRKIGLHKLADVSGVSIKTINGWSQTKSWVERRTKFQEELGEEIKNQVVKKQGSVLSDALSEIELEHAEQLKTIRKCAFEYFVALLESIEEAKATGDPEAILRGVNYEKFDKMSLAISRIIESERKALHLDLTDINVAFKLVEAAGMKISIPDVDAIEAEFSESD